MAAPRAATSAGTARTPGRARGAGPHAAAVLPAPPRPRPTLRAGGPTSRGHPASSGQGRLRGCQRTASKMAAGDGHLGARDPDDPPAYIRRAAVEDGRKGFGRALNALELADHRPQLPRSQQRRELGADRIQPLRVKVADDITRSVIRLNTASRRSAPASGSSGRA